jgi:type IV pilus assembly protein PilX
MSRHSAHRAPAERGVALVTSLLLLVIITLLALSMFRSLTTQQKISGNEREKERAQHAANSALQYAEAWLLVGGNTALGDTACAAGTLYANLGSGQICTLSLYQQGISVTTVPWSMQTLYTPPGMSTTAGVNGALGAGDPPYYQQPGFYISDDGAAADGEGEAYLIDAYGYGGQAATVAVVESVYEVQQGVVPRNGP